MSGETRTISRIVEDDAWVADVLEHLGEQTKLLNNVLKVVRGNRAMIEATRAELAAMRKLDAEEKKRRWWRFGQ